MPQNVIPKVCCRCAQKQGTYPWKISSTQISLTGFYIIAYRTRTSSYSFDVRVCDSCKKELERIKKNSKLILYIFIIIGVVILPVLAGLDASTLIINIIAGGVGGLLIGNLLALIFKNIKGYKLGSYNGTQLQFANKEYQNIFTVINSFVSEESRKENFPGVIGSREAEITSLEREISLLKTEISKLNNQLPKMPNPIFFFLFMLGGCVSTFFAFALENIIALIFLGLLGLGSIVAGFTLIAKRNKLYRENYKAKYDEVEKRKQDLQKLINKKIYLQNS